MLSAVVVDFAHFKRTKKKWTDKTEAEDRAAYIFFKRIIGEDRPIADIDDEIIEAYSETLQKLPANVNAPTGRYVGMDIVDIVALTPTPMAVRTVNKNLERISSLFKWAMTRKKYGVTHNPATGMALDTRRLRPVYCLLNRSDVPFACGAASALAWRRKSRSASMNICSYHSAALMRLAAQFLDAPSRMLIALTQATT